MPATKSSGERERLIPPRQQQHEQPSMLVLFMQNTCKGLSRYTPSSLSATAAVVLVSAMVFFVVGVSYGYHVATARATTTATSEVSAVEVIEDLARPTLRVAFQNGGDSAWFAATTLARLAFPEHTVVLINQPNGGGGGHGDGGSVAGAALGAALGRHSDVPMLKHVRGARADELLLLQQQQETSTLGGDEQGMGVKEEGVGGGGGGGGGRGDENWKRWVDWVNGGRGHAGDKAAAEAAAVAEAAAADKASAGAPSKTDTHRALSSSGTSPSSAPSLAVAVDLVVEGPASRRGDAGGCTAGSSGTPWVQVSMEGHWGGGAFYADGDGADGEDGEGHQAGELGGSGGPRHDHRDAASGNRAAAAAAAAAACYHDNPPLVRLEATADGRVKGRLARTPTRYLWSPPIAAAAELYRNTLSHRGVASMVPKPHDRPHLVAYLAHECKSHRTAFFNALTKEAKGTERAGRRVGGVHGLGACSHNHRWSPEHAYPPLDTPPSELYKNYRFVLAFENDFDEGYATGKLAAALAGGAVPIYFGDGAAAARVFDRRTYVDVRMFFTFLKRADKKAEAEQAARAGAAETAAVRAGISAASRAAAVAGVGSDVVNAEAVAAMGRIQSVRNAAAAAAAATLGRHTSKKSGGETEAAFTTAVQDVDKEAAPEEEQYEATNITEKDWEALAAYVLDLDSDETRYNAYLRDDAFAAAAAAAEGAEGDETGSALGSVARGYYAHPFPLGAPGDAATLGGEEGAQSSGVEMSEDVKAAVDVLKYSVKPGGTPFIAAEHK